MRIPLLLELRARGFAVGAAGSEPPEPFERADIPYWRYPLRRALSPLADLRSIRSIAAAFREASPDVVHAFDTKPCLLVPEAGARSGVRVCIRTIAGLGSVFSPELSMRTVLRPVYRALQRRASAKSTVTVFQNRDDLAYFEAHGMLGRADAELVEGSGVDVAEIRRAAGPPARIAHARADLLDGGSRLVVMVSRLVRQKGVLEYLEAARRAKEARPDCRFVLVGGRATEGRDAISEALLKSYGEVVQVLGRRDDVPTILAASDLAVLPTWYGEGLPRVLLEAGALGVPVIASDAPGCRDLVADGTNGWLVPARDVDALTSALLMSLDCDPKHLDRIGEAARTTVESRYTLEMVADAYAGLYRRLTRPDGAA